jgi:hypothetical protein
LVDGLKQSSAPPLNRVGLGQFVSLAVGSLRMFAGMFRYNKTAVFAIPQIGGGPIMATITKRQAVDRLTQAVTQARPDDLAEIYNELFPGKPITEDEAKKDPSALVTKIVAHIDRGLELEEILDLRYVILPKHRRVWFDEEDGLIHYDEETEPVGQAD